MGGDGNGRLVYKAIKQAETIARSWWRAVPRSTALARKTQIAVSPGLWARTGGSGRADVFVPEFGVRVDELLQEADAFKGVEIYNVDACVS
jgi:hypothetical protein